MSAEVHCDDIEAAVAAASPHYIVEHGMDVGVEAEALDMMGAPAKQELIPVDLDAVVPPPAPRVVTTQPIEPTSGPPPLVALDVFLASRAPNSTELLAMHGYRAAFAGHHGDGVGIVEVNHHGSGVPDHHGSGVPAVPQPGDCFARDVTDEKVEALRWKCSLQKMPAPFIKEVVLRLDDEVIADIVKQYNGRDAAVPNTRRKRFIVERYCHVDHKKEAV